MREEVAVACFDIISRHSPGEIETRLQNIMLLNFRSKFEFRLGAYSAMCSGVRKTYVWAALCEIYCVLWIYQTGFLSSRYFAA